MKTLRPNIESCFWTLRAALPALIFNRLPATGSLADILYRFPHQFNKEINRKGARQPQRHFVSTSLLFQKENQQKRRQAACQTVCIDCLIILIRKSIEKEPGSLADILYRYARHPSSRLAPPKSMFLYYV